MFFSRRPRPKNGRPDGRDVRFPSDILFDSVGATPYFGAMSDSPDRTILAIDYGTRRIGLAKSDPTGLIASALATLEVKSKREALARIERVIADTAPSAIVIGYPLHESGEVSETCRKVDAFIEALGRVYAGPIFRVDEGDSSIEASRIIHAHGKQSGRKKGRIDRLAAVIILQRYLDEQTSR
jgi:putative Holliday junction resolvase